MISKMYAREPNKIKYKVFERMKLEKESNRRVTEERVRVMNRKLDKTKGQGP